MTHTIYAVTLSLLAINAHYIIASQKPNEPTPEQKKQWEADAEKYKRMVTALGGKMLHSGEEKQATNQQNKPNFINTPSTEIRPKL